MTDLPKFATRSTSELVRSMLSSLVWDLDYHGWYMPLVILVLQGV